MADTQIAERPVDNLSLIDKLDKDGVATLLALLQTKTATEAASILSISRQALYVRINKYKIDAIIAEFPKQALTRLRMHSVAAADKIGELVNSPKEAISLQASTEVLDRVGITGTPDVLVQNNTNVSLPGEFEKYDTVSPVAVGSSQGPDQVPGS